MLFFNFLEQIAYLFGKFSSMRKKGIPVLPENDTTSIRMEDDIVESAIRQNDLEVEHEQAQVIETEINSEHTTPLSEQDHPYKV